MPSWDATPRLEQETRAIIREIGRGRDEKFYAAFKAAGITISKADFRQLRNEGLTPEQRLSRGRFANRGTKPSTAQIPRLPRSRRKDGTRGPLVPGTDTYSVRMRPRIPEGEKNPIPGDGEVWVRFQAPRGLSVAQIKRRARRVAGKARDIYGVQRWEPLQIMSTRPATANR